VTGGRADVDVFYKRVPRLDVDDQDAFLNDIEQIVRTQQENCDEGKESYGK
jgi:hypothetical protein